MRCISFDTYYASNTYEYDMMHMNMHWKFFPASKKISHFFQRTLKISIELILATNAIISGQRLYIPL